MAVPAIPDVQVERDFAKAIDYVAFVPEYKLVDWQ
jgi:hypothetical protein